MNLLHTGQSSGGEARFTRFIAARRAKTCLLSKQNLNPKMGRASHPSRFRPLHRIAVYPDTGL